LKAIKAEFECCGRAIEADPIPAKADNGRRGEQELGIKRESSICFSGLDMLWITISKAYHMVLHVHGFLAIEVEDNTLCPQPCAIIIPKSLND
jgi:hypothetical protein